MTRFDPLRAAPALALAACLVGLPAAADDEAPRRQSGLWEVVLSAEQIPGGTMTMQTCVDRASDDLSALDKSVGDCGEPSIRQDGARWIIEATCKTKEGTVESRTVVSGDFERGFRAESEARYDPPVAGMSTIRSRVEGRRIGPCKPGQKHGDVVMPGFEELMRGAGSAQ